MSQNRRESLPVAQMLGMYRVPFHLPMLDLRKWVWASFTWWPEAESLRLALQEPVLTQGPEQAEQELTEAAAMSSSSWPVVRPLGFKTVTGSDQTHVVQLLPQWPPAWCYYVILFARQLAFILRAPVIRNARNILMELALSCREPREWGLASTLFLHKEKTGERREVGHPGLHWRPPPLLLTFL